MLVLLVLMLEVLIILLSCLLKHNACLFSSWIILWITSIFSFCVFFPEIKHWRNLSDMCLFMYISVCDNIFCGFKFSFIINSTVCFKVYMKGFLICLHVLLLLLLICVTFEVQLMFSCEPLGLNYFAYLLEYSGLFNWTHIDAS